MPLIPRAGALPMYNLSFPHPVSDKWYHRMMTNQLRQLATITGESAFSEWADLLAEDEAALRAALEAAVRGHATVPDGGQVLAARIR